jgi:DNA-binding IclR family transcriptional regulator
MTTLARTTDPHTSHDVAEAVTTSGKAQAHRALALREVRALPGQTSGELAAAAGLERHEAARRLSDLKNAGLVLQGAARRCTALGTTQVTWWPAQEQGALSL